MIDQRKSDLPPADRPPEASSNAKNPYTAFYTFALRDVIGQLDDAALRIYVLLATYADGRGICWPGIAELSERAVLRQERVIKALQTLEALGLLTYVRRAEKDAVTGRQLPNVYGLTAAVYRVSESAKADSGLPPKADSALEGKNGYNQNHQPESRIRIKEPESRTTTTNQIKASKPDDLRSGSQPDWTQWRAGQLPNGASGAGVHYANTSEAETARNALSAQSANQKPPPPFRAAPSPDLSQYQRPLPDEFAEQQAERLHERAGNMSMPNARALVAAHGVGHVAAALVLLSRQTKIENPGGYVRALLQRGAVDPVKDTDDPYAKWGTLGEAARQTMAELEQNQTESEAQNGTND